MNNPTNSSNQIEAIGITGRAFNLIAENSHLTGTINLDQISHIYGKVAGTIKAAAGSLIVIKPSGQIEGKIEADSIIVDGFFEGELIATGKVTLSRTARVLGKIITNNLVIENGAFFEGEAIHP